MFSYFRRLTYFFDDKCEHEILFCDLHLHIYVPNTNTTDKEFALELYQQCRDNNRKNII